jgi:hypothetical protein
MPLCLMAFFAGAPFGLILAHVLLATWQGPDEPEKPPGPRPR